MYLRNKLILYTMVVMILFNVLSNNTLFAMLQTYGSTESNINNPFPSASSFQSKAAILDNMPSHNVTVDDINIAYKQMGYADGKPIILITGASSTMDMWNPLLLEALISSNYKVIIFENRGVGDSIVGTKDFSINQFADDTLGLLNVLRIDKADILGWSMGGFIAQQLAATNPDRVSNLILYATSCGGSNDRPTPPEIIAIDKNTTMSQSEKMQKLAPMFFAPASWFEAHPDYTNYFPIPKEYPISQQIHQKQLNASTTWAGICNTLSSITVPTLIIVGTDDDPVPDSLTLADGIPGSWLIRIGEAGHALMYQHPDDFNRIVKTFLDINKE